MSISFSRLSKAEYDALETKVANRIYFISDTGEQYLDGLPYDGEDRRDYLCLTAAAADSQVCLMKSGTAMPDLDLEYSTDKRNWTRYAWDGTAGTLIALAAVGDKVYFRGDNQTFTQSSSQWYRFWLKGTVNPSGNLMSLVDRTCEALKIPDTGGRFFYTLFQGEGVYGPDGTHCDSAMTDVSGLRLPATELAEYCYGSLFSSQRRLVNGAVSLPATTMKANCYRGLFGDCSSLLYPPELPALVLAEGCYSNMFMSCTALTQAPKLPAKVLATDCYKTMFRHNQSLAEIEVGFADWGSAATNWLAEGVPATGVFKCPAALDTTTRDASHIPAGWSVVYTDIPESGVVPAAAASDAGKVLAVDSNGAPGWETPQAGGGGDPLDYLCFTALFTASGGNSYDVWLNKSNSSLADLDLEYSTDGTTWTQYAWESGATAGTLIPLNVLGDKVYFRGDNATFSAGSNSYYSFSFSHPTRCVAASGNIMSLLDKTCQRLDVPTYCFYDLFYNQNALYTAPELPALSLGNYCYQYMFAGCTSLVKGPKLPALTLGTGAYSGMFSGCTALEEAPEFAATSAGGSAFNGMFSGCTSLIKGPAKLRCNSGYQYMFQNCTSLKEAPEFAFTNIADFNLQSMFAGCTSLIKVPDFPAVTLNSSTCQNMFQNCTSLKEAPNLAAVRLGDRSSYCFKNMFAGCTRLIKGPAALPASFETTNVFEAMFYGCTSLTQAPELPAAVRYANDCYKSMFSNCSSLRYLKTAATNLSGRADYMLAGVAEGGILEAPDALDATAFLPATWTKVPAANAPDSGTASAVDASSEATYAVLPSAETTGVVTVATALTLAAGTADAAQIAYAELVLDVASGAQVTAGANLALVDAPVAGKRNHCIVRWQDGAARLYVVDTEALPA